MTVAEKKTRQKEQQDYNSQKTKTGDGKGKSNDSPEITDRGEI